MRYIVKASPEKEIGKQFLHMRDALAFWDRLVLRGDAHACIVRLSTNKIVFGY
jgi:hypothetical protein